MQSCAAAWLMTEMSDDARLVGGVYAATTFALFLALAPIGALADLVDRRRLAHGTALLLATVAVGLATLALLGLLDPMLLLALLFISGLGEAALASGLPLGGQAHRSAAGQRSGAPGFSITTGRAGGSAAGGLALSAAGAAAVFLAYAAALLAVGLSLRRLPPDRVLDRPSPRRVSAALAAGVATVAQTPSARNLLARGAGFAFGASALWALLVVVVREDLRLGALEFGLLQAVSGLGAVAAVVCLPRLPGRWSIGSVGSASAMVYAGALVALALVRGPVAVAGCLLVAGLAWFTVVSVYLLGAQQCVPAELRARALAIHVSLVYLAVAVGSMVWTHLAETGGLRSTVLVAAATVAGATVVTAWLPVGRLRRWRSG